MKPYRTGQSHNITSARRLIAARMRVLCTLCGILIGATMLGGCSITNIFKSLDTNYTISGLENDKETAAYLEKILAQRLIEKTKNLADEDEENGTLRARQENYIEQTISADLIKALQSRGYYNGRVRFTDDEAPFTGEYRIRAGPRYTIRTVTVTPEDFASDLDQNAPKTGDALNADHVLKTQAALLRRIGEGKCYYDLSVSNQVKLDRRQRSADVTLIAKAGREATFGALTIEGNKRVKQSYIRLLQPWREGACFHRAQLEDFKTSLLQSGLFSTADIILPDDGPDENGVVPVKIILKERAQRTLSAGLNYYSDEGIGGVLGWEHRNFFGAAETVRTTLNISTLKQSLDAEFNKPFFIRKDQSLHLNSALRREDTDAYVELALEAGGALKRKFGRYTTASTGVAASILRIDDQTLNTSKTYGLISAPQSLSYDTRDDALDPQKGVNVTLTVEPFFDLLGEADPFVKSQLTGSTYVPLSDRFVIAAKAGLGSILGNDIESIPATKRFYAGGGGSVRGYGYQEVGPHKNGDPSGGLSLATLSLELRTKITEQFGAVAFVDGGSVTEDALPSFENAAIGAGLGIRYYTAFAPIRFDVAVPLTEKDNLDQNFQIYISIGQAF